MKAILTKRTVHEYFKKIINNSKKKQDKKEIKKNIRKEKKNLRIPFLKKKNSSLHSFYVLNS